MDKIKSLFACFYVTLQKENGLQTLLHADFNRFIYLKIYYLVILSFTVSMLHVLTVVISVNYA